MAHAPSSSAATPLPEAFKNPDFRKRRTQNWIFLGLLYAVFYMSRYNFSAVMVNLSSTFGWTNTQLGVFETMMPLVYGLSVVLNGPLADRIGGRRAFLSGAVGVTIMNFLFGLCIYAVRVPAIMAGTGHEVHVVMPAAIAWGLSSNQLLWIMAVIWGINGYFQSFGALSIVKVNANWFHIRERGTFAGIFGILIRLGLILAFSGVPLILTVLPLPFAFLIPGFLVGALCVANYFVLANTPKDAGFDGLDPGDGIDQNDTAPASLTYVLKRVFANRITWTLAFCSMMLGMVRRSTVDSWYPKYFKEMFLSGGGSLASYVPYQATAWGIAIFGIIGGIAFGMASDRIYGGRRGPVIAIGFLGMGILLAAFGLADQIQASPWVAMICLSVLSFFVNGAHGMIGGAASMDFGGRKAAATAAGLFDGMQYLASSFVGIGMGYTLDHWGWKAWHWVPIPFAIIGGLLVLTLWNAVPTRSAQK